jgi:hypothetical protein
MNVLLIVRARIDARLVCVICGREASDRAIILIPFVNRTRMTLFISGTKIVISIFLPIDCKYEPIVYIVRYKNNDR